NRPLDFDLLYTRIILTSRVPVFSRTNSLGGSMHERNLSRAAAILGRIFSGAKVKSGVAVGKTGQIADFAVKTGGTLLVVEIKEMNSTRLLDLEGRLASAALQAIRYAGDLRASPVVMVSLPKLGPKASAYGAKFMATNAPGVGWCLFDSLGA